jgi:hypothetical protein
MLFHSDHWQRFARLAGFCFILITGKGSPGWQVPGWFLITGKYFVK